MEVTKPRAGDAAAGRRVDPTGNGAGHRDGTAASLAGSPNAGRGAGSGRGADAGRGGTARRLADVVAGSVLLLASAPVLAGAAIAVLVASGRPVFFGHVRVGQGGRPFRCWKLRTMEPGAEERLRSEPRLRRRYVENGYKLPDHADPRVTAVGRWLRRRYLDELPQLVNVVAGTMSLVGPRPVVADELACYGDGAGELLGVKPGIFGEWTSHGVRRPDYPERAALELAYVRRQSFSGDLRILARSIGVVLKGQPVR